MASAAAFALLSDSISLSKKHHQSPSSSDRGSDYDSDTARSSSPDSVYEPSDFDGLKPSTHLCVTPSAMNSAGWLSRMFDQHAVDGVLGLCVGSAAPDMQRTAAEDSFEYLVLQGNTQMFMFTEKVRSPVQ